MTDKQNPADAEQMHDEFDAWGRQELHMTDRDLQRNQHGYIWNMQINMFKAWQGAKSRLSAPPESVPNTFKLPNENDDAWIDRITGAELPPESVAAVPGWKLVPICLTPEMRVELLNVHGLATAELYAMLLAAAPPAPAREPLTIAQINEAWNFAVETSDPTSAQLRFKFTRAIEIAHNIKAAK